MELSEGSIAPRAMQLAHPPERVKPGALGGAAGGMFDLMEQYDGIFNPRNLLGEGSYGKVYRAVDKETGQQVALKVMDMKKMTPREKQETLHELAILERVTTQPTFPGSKVVPKRCAHPGVVCYYGSQLTSQYLVVVMELIEGRTLEDWIAEASEEETFVSDEHAQILCERLLEALAFVHARGVAHRDIKPANIMLRAPSPRGFPDPVLIDFGVACQTARRSGVSNVRRGAAPCLASPETMGTPLFMGPAQWDYGPLRGKAMRGTELPRAVLQQMQAGDVWGLGVSLFVATHHHFPYPEPEPAEDAKGAARAIQDAITYGAMETPTRTGPAVIQALQEMLIRDYEKRPEAVAIRALFLRPRAVELTAADARAIQSVLQQEKDAGAVAEFAVSPSPLGLPPDATASFTVNMQVAPQLIPPSQAERPLWHLAVGRGSVVFAHKVFGVDQRGIYQLWSGTAPLPHGPSAAGFPQRALPRAPPAPREVPLSPLPSPGSPLPSPKVQADAQNALQVAAQAHEGARAAGDAAIAAKERGSPPGVQAVAFEQAQAAAAAAVSAAARLVALTDAAGEGATPDERALVRDMHQRAVMWQQELARHSAVAQSLAATAMSLEGKEEDGLGWEGLRAPAPAPAPAPSPGRPPTSGQEPLPAPVLAAMAAEEARMDTAEAEAAARVSEDVAARVSASVRRMRKHEREGAAAEARAQQARRTLASARTAKQRDACTRKIQMAQRAVLEHQAQARVAAEEAVALRAAAVARSDGGIRSRSRKRRRFGVSTSSERTGVGDVSMQS